MVLHPVLYFVHIGMGTVALLAGAMALFTRRGSRVHRASGNAFFGSMLAMSATGAYGAIYVPEMLTVVVGVLTFYLVATAWITVRRKPGETGLFEYVAPLVALTAAAGGFYFGAEAAASETGLKDGFPAGAYFFFGSVALIAAIGDVRMLARGGVKGARRIVRHLWRMGFAMFVATGSLFLGQPQVFPEAVRKTEILILPVLVVTAVALIRLAQMLFEARPRTFERRRERRLGAQ